jgi:2',3'-cyclic-nucleotide 2'-phosphodiesterase (5'-nucleotidase family)
VDFTANGEPTVTATSLALDETVAKDPAYQQLEDQWRAELLRLYPIINAKVGEAALAFDVREEVIRNSESSWGNFIVDQARAAFGAPSADFAFVNSGTIRIDDYILGDISYEDIA